MLIIIFYYFKGVAPWSPSCHSAWWEIHFHASFFCTYYDHFLWLLLRFFITIFEKLDYDYVIWIMLWNLKDSFPHIFLMLGSLLSFLHLWIFSLQQIWKFLRHYFYIVSFPLWRFQLYICWALKVAHISWIFCLFIFFLCVFCFG